MADGLFDRLLPYLVLGVISPKNQEDISMKKKS
jgi:hypothetical protein